MEELLVFLNEMPMGVLTRDSKGRLSFRYDNDYPAKKLKTLLRDFLEKSGGAAAETHDELLANGIEHPIIETLSRRIEHRGKELISCFSEAGF